MAKRYSLSATPRIIFGKKVKQLRRANLVPANVYGHNVEPVAISLEQKPFLATFKKAGETGLIDLQIGEDKATRPALVHSVLLDPVSNAILHVDFYQVNLKEKLTATVPLEFVGESPIVKNKEGILLELLQEVEVESLPTDIPSSIVVDISILVEVDQGIVAGDLPLPAGVELQTEADEMVCKIDSALMAEEVVEEVVAPESVEAVPTENADKSEEAAGNG